ncbi:hypothetical protein niasHS_017137 [Heterodera schachtii]|uniref:Nuclear receptor domain-containing protein n=1 Tax=Heterodera schachtii TaxID=97005 RepID=A0ABD2I7R0_HETSC
MDISAPPNCSTEALENALRMEREFIQRVLLGPQRGNLTVIGHLMENSAQNQSPNLPMPFGGCAPNWQNSRIQQQQQQIGTVETRQNTDGMTKLVEGTNLAEEWQKILARPRRRLTGCRVCGRHSQYCYYGAKCCESCKQFFRRSVAKQIRFTCFGDQKCQINEEGIRCRGCRLEKCLMAGMDPKMVNAEQNESHAQFLAWLEQRKRSAIMRTEEVLIYQQNQQQRN